MSSMCMSAGCGRRSTRASTGRCFTPCAAPAIACAPVGRIFGKMTAPDEAVVSAQAATDRSGGGPVSKWILAFAANPGLSLVPLRLIATTSVRAAQRLMRTHAFRLAGLYFLVFAVSVVGVL